jgi:hypothetical protein
MPFESCSWSPRLAPREWPAMLWYMACVWAIYILSPSLSPLRTIITSRYSTPLLWLYLFGRWEKEVWCQDYGRPTSNRPCHSMGVCNRVHLYLPHYLPNRWLALSLLLPLTASLLHPSLVCIPIPALSSTLASSPVTPSLGNPHA